MTCTSPEHSMLFVDLTVLSNCMTLELWPVLHCCVRRWIDTSDLHFQGTISSKMSVQIIIQTLTNVKKVRQACYRPRGFQKIETPKLRKSAYGGHKVRSALNTGCLYPPGNTPGHFC